MAEQKTTPIIPGVGIMPATVATSKPHKPIRTAKSDTPKRTVTRTTYDIPDSPSLSKEELDRFKKEHAKAEGQSRAGSARAVAIAILSQKIKGFLENGTPVERAQIIAEIQEACPNTTHNGVAAAYQHARMHLGLTDER